MAIFDGNMPYTNFHELNLDWIVSKVKKLDDAYGDIVNTINNTLIQMIRDGTLVITLNEVYNAETEELTLTVGGVING